jgi:hypothetical protein
LIVLAGAAAQGCGADKPASPGPTKRPDPNFVRLQSDPGDYIGAGQSYNYTQANALIALTASEGHLSVRIDGDERWLGEFQAPGTPTQLQRGAFANLERYLSYNASLGGLDWFGEGRGCNTISGSLTIDSVTYAANNLTAIDLRFEQHCEGRVSALRGTLHWRSDDQTRPPGPVNPIPAGLWRPSPGSTPTTGNYVYLSSEAGDHIGRGRTINYTPVNDTIALTADSGQLVLNVNGSRGWLGNFRTMTTLSRFESGYYADLRRYPFHNPAKGGLSWSGEGRGCNTLVGWFAIERVTYGSGNLTALDLRFEQLCEGSTAPLHGAIHWER